MCTASARIHIAYMTVDSIPPILYTSQRSARSLLGLSLILCSENCLLYVLALLQFCAYYARFYATPQSSNITQFKDLSQ